MRLVHHFQHDLNHPMNLQIFIKWLCKPFSSLFIRIFVGLTYFHRSFLSLCFKRRWCIYLSLGPWEGGQSSAIFSEIALTHWWIALLLASWKTPHLSVCSLTWSPFVCGLHPVLALSDTGLLLSADCYTDFPQVTGDSRYGLPFFPSQNRWRM